MRMDGPGLQAMRDILDIYARAHARRHLREDADG
jgi:hypothetical protein